MEAECCYRLNPTAFFPYKRVIVGGKIKIFPLRDSKGNLCGFEPQTEEQLGAGGGPSSSRTTDGGSTSSSCPCTTTPASLPNLKRRYPCVTSPACPTMGDIDQIPMTAAMKTALVPTEEDVCRHLVTPLQRLSAGKQDLLNRQLRARILDMERETNKVVYPTPMSAFRNDDRSLRKSIRLYKRDVQLEKERGTYREKPRYFYDENTKTWYDDMVRSGKQCTNRATRELLNRSDCVTFADAAGGSCFHCPERNI